MRRQQPSDSRRTFLKGVGVTLALTPFAQLLACGEGTGEGDSDTEGDTQNPADETGGTGNWVAWATGGTAALTGTFPDPFAEGLGSTCTLYKKSTLGPCHALTVERKDISEGMLGLPLRLAFLIVDSSCTPIPGASVELWHTAPSGLYSGSDTSNMCTQGDAEAKAARWFRGIQSADDQGRVDFDTCFPGWYSSRTIHIHFTVRVGGTEYLTSQLFFDDALNNAIISTEALYADRGAKDTTNARDNVIRESSLTTDAYLQTEQMGDGTLLAWKTLVIQT